MDRMIVRYDAIEDRDLNLCISRGVAYQRRMNCIKYDAGYFENYKRLEGQQIAVKLNEGRKALVDKYIAGRLVIDVGIGSGEFIKTRPNTTGRDVNPVAMEWLRSQGKLAENYDSCDGVTFWDVIEHVPDINAYFKRIPYGKYLFTSLPIFDDLRKIRESKHYKPDEHLYYWTRQGFIDWMALYGFRLLEDDDRETKAGRESIRSFAFKRDLPNYHDTIGQYEQIYSKIYGASSRMYLEYMAPHIIKMNPKSILDYGCGRSDLVSYFWNDGNRRIERYDPAVHEFQRMPEGTFDLVICNDVMEHVLMYDVDRVFNEIAEKSKTVIFTISLIPARAHLPDGRNAHVTLLNDKEWRRWIEEVFGAAHPLRLPWPNLLMLKTFG